MSEYRLVMKGVVKTFPGVKALDHAQLEMCIRDSFWGSRRRASSNRGVKYSSVPALVH